MKRPTYKYLAYHDCLTGCFNRNYLEYVAMEQYKNTEIYVVYIDINDLKKLNDEQGHSIGNILIKEVVDSVSRFGDIIRLGGDEFVLFCEDINDFENFAKSQNKFSYGFVIKTKSESLKKTITRADEKMYKHKKSK